MTTAPSRESPGGRVTLHIDHFPAVDANSVTYSISFNVKTAMGAVLLGRVQGLDALRGVLQKLKLNSLAVEAACSTMTHHACHEIPDVDLTPSLIRELGL